MAKIAVQPRTLAADKIVALANPTSVAVTRDRRTLADFWSHQRLMAQLCTRLIPSDTHQFLPFPSVRFGVGSMQQVNRHMRSFVTQHLKQELSRCLFEPAIQPDLPGLWVHPPKGLGHPSRKDNYHPTRKLGRAPRRGPIGQNLGVVERFARHGLPWRQNYCLSAGELIQEYLATSVAPSRQAMKSRNAMGRAVDSAIVESLHAHQTAGCPQTSAG